jgi:hypothetical protein
MFIQSQLIQLHCPRRTKKILTLEKGRPRSRINSVAVFHEQSGRGRSHGLCVWLFSLAVVTVVSSDVWRCVALPTNAAGSLGEH